jgi:hypothetical protein
VCVCVRERERENHHNLKLLAAALPEKKDYTFIFENLVCSTECLRTVCFTDYQTAQDRVKCKLLLKNC